jgi:hypothetical protein
METNPIAVANAFEIRYVRCPLSNWQQTLAGPGGRSAVLDAVIVIPVVEEIRSSFGTDQAGRWELGGLSSIWLRRALSISDVCPISCLDAP